MSESVRLLKEFHATEHFGSRENLLRQQARAADLYRSLDPGDIRELARHAIDSCVPDTIGVTEDILLRLACFQPGSLDEFYGTLVDLGIMYPGVIFQGADAAIAGRMLGLVSAENADHLLQTLAWIGDDVVRGAFNRWRAEPPGWAAKLFIPPHRYAAQAGWELTPQGNRRELFVRECRPLVGADDPTKVGGVTVAGPHEETCRWCDHALTTLIDLDLSSPGLAFLGLKGRRLRIGTCVVCACYGPIFTTIDPDGASTWHPENRRPDYLPDRSEPWAPIPADGLALGGAARGWLEAADPALEGVRFSQVGGCPTWEQDAEYPPCPECHRPMPFVAQLSNADYQSYGEGFYYMFACDRCGVAATVYQQT